MQERPLRTPSALHLPPVYAVGRRADLRQVGPHERPRREFADNGVEN